MTETERPEDTKFRQQIERARTLIRTNPTASIEFKKAVYNVVKLFREEERPISKKQAEGMFLGITMIGLELVEQGAMDYFSLNDKKIATKETIKKLKS